MIEQSAVPIVRVDDGPLIGVFNFPVTKPHERIESLPIASGFFSGIFDVQSSKSRHCVGSKERRLVVRLSLVLANLRLSASLLRRVGCRRVPKVAPDPHRRLKEQPQHQRVLHIVGTVHNLEETAEVVCVQDAGEPSLVIQRPSRSKARQRAA